MAAEKERAVKRRNIIFQLPVYDEESGELLGHLVDITASGLRLVSAKPIPAERLFKLRMELPEDYFVPRDLRLKARSRWTRPDVNPELSTTGFTLEEMTGEAEDVVARLVSLHAFND
ncbi:PilZ domain-containing protein [Desulfurivibrio alkaliphilus]|uniref:Type IV pilus assembly PilZ n=1 Tax=Desulfurivibrio alkaliphilus (strain DSM 19089 / UNIQEM U267 / AHT2) TaxID=589865 RepID=D6Z1J9_DESAT|nr:PilZ domain-containing protein [Desulfurivibrio alkaliphilus]ADH87333.1 type IV pilus assembly PilZ [Desulfurivibrio alkaliphilus AHT 2]